MDLGSARMATSARGALANLWAGCCVSGLRVRGVCLYSVLGSFGSGFERFAFGRQHKSRSFREISAAAPMSCAAPMSRAGAKHMAIKLIGKLIVDPEVDHSPIALAPEQLCPPPSLCPAPPCHPPPPLCPHPPIPTPTPHPYPRLTPARCSRVAEQRTRNDANTDALSTVHLPAVNSDRGGGDRESM